MNVLSATTGKIGSKFGIILSLGIPGAQAKSGRHLTLLADCSGSMSAALDDVKGDSAKLVAEMGDKDYVSIIAFSGEGQARLIVSPTQCTAAGRSQIQAGIQHLDIIGTTVFAEPLELALKTVQNLKVDADHVVVLLTDGCAVPTRRSVIEEESKAGLAARAIANVGATLSIVGYGNWYNPVFLARLMAESGSVGTYKHVSDIGHFGEAVKEILDTASRMTRAGVELTLTPNVGQVSQIIRTTPEVGGTRGAVFQTTGVYEGEATLFIETSQPPSNVTIEGRINGKPISQRIELQPMSAADKIACGRVLGAWSFLSGDVAASQSYFNETGDDVLADEVNNTFSDREKRGTGDKMRHAFTSGRHFFGSGLKSSGPNHNVMNVLRLLLEDKGAVIRIPRGAYKRGGVATADPRIIELGGDKSLEVRDIISHESRLNFSFRTLKDIKLRPESGEGRPTDAKVWRSYNIVRDGNLVMTEIEAANISEATYHELVLAGVVSEKGGYQANKTYTVDLSGLKLTSRAWAQPRVLGLVQLLKNEADLEAKQKLLNARKRALKDAGQATLTASDTEESNIYHGTSKKVDGLVEEHYQAPNVEYRLMGYKPTIALDVDSMDYATADAMVKAVRQDLAVTRFKARSIVFACEQTGSREIPWGTPKGPNKKGVTEQLASFDGAELKRATSTETCVCS